MTRVVAIVLTAVFGAAALLLVAGPVRASYVDGTANCSSVVGAAAADPVVPARAAAACDAALVHRAELTGLSVLVCLVAGSAAVLGAGQPEYGTSLRHSPSS